MTRAGIKTGTGTEAVFNRSQAMRIAFVVAIAFVILPFQEGMCAEKEADSGVIEGVYTVNGSSMSPLFIAGDTVTVLEGYYKYNPVERGDIVFHRYSSDKNPIIKTVKGIAGDTLALEQVVNKDTNVKEEAWNIIINGKIITNSQGQKYEIPLAGYKMLSLYINSYHGAIPEGTVLLMGEQPSGSFDAVRIGLTAVSDLVGKVITEPRK